MSLTPVATPAGPDQDTGEALLNDVFDLIAERLPRLPLDDPARPALAVLCPLMGQSLGRPCAIPSGGSA